MHVVLLLFAVLCLCNDRSAPRRRCTSSFFCSSRSCALVTIDSCLRGSTRASTTQMRRWQPRRPHYKDTHDVTRGGEVKLDTGSIVHSRNHARQRRSPRSRRQMASDTGPADGAYAPCHATPISLAIAFSVSTLYSWAGGATASFMTTRVGTPPFSALSSATTNLKNSLPNLLLKYAAICFSSGICRCAFVASPARQRRAVDAAAGELAARPSGAPAVPATRARRLRRASLNPPRLRAAARRTSAR